MGEAPSLYRDPPRYDAISESISDDLPWWQQQVGYIGCRVLELGCGSGRIALAVQRCGAEVWGVDYAAPMLAAARAKDGADHVHWLQADMRDGRVPGYDHHFDAVIIGNNTLAHLLSSEDLRATFAVARAHLQQQGKLLIDTFAPDQGMRQAGQEELLRYCDPHTGQQVRLVEVHEYLPQRQYCHVQWHHLYPGQRFPSAEPEELWLRPWTLTEIDLALQEAGLQRVASFGDYNHSPYNADARLLLIEAHPVP